MAELDPPSAASAAGSAGVPPAPTAGASSAPPAAGSARPRRRAAWLLGVLAAAGLAALAWVMFLHGLGAFGLVGPDEPRYAAIGAEMLAAKNFITPKLLGRPWLEKPALEYWLIAGGDAVRGIGAAGSRLGNALLGLLLVLALAVAAAKLHGWRAAGWTAALAATSVFLFVFARAATTDLPLAAMMTFSLLCLYAWLRPQIAGGAPAGREWLWAAAAFLGLAVLAKGPVAIVLEGLVLVLMALRYRRWDWPRAVLRPGAIGIFAVVTLPWYIAVAVRTPAFLKIFFWQNNLERFATNRYQHPQPAWFYLPVVFLAVFPWSGWSLLPLRNLLRPARRAAPRDGLLWFLWLWVAVPVGFFSLSHSKLPGYILPAIPAVILLIALAASREGIPRWPGLLSAILTGAVPVGVLLFPWLFTPAAWRPPARYFLRNPSLWAAGLGTVIVLGILVWRRQFAVYLAVTCAILAAAVWALTGPLAPQVNAIASARPLATAVWAECGPAAEAPLPLRAPRAATAPFAAGACAGENLYQFHLARAMTYGLGFYLHRQPLPLAGQAAWPLRGLAAVNRRDVPAFVNAAARHGRAARIAMPAPAGANWALLWLAAGPSTAAPGLTPMVRRQQKAHSRLLPDQAGGKKAFGLELPRQDLDVAFGRGERGRLRPQAALLRQAREHRSQGHQGHVGAPPLHFGQDRFAFLGLQGTNRIEHLAAGRQGGDGLF